MLKYITNIFFGALIFTSFPLIASDKDKEMEPSSSVGERTSRSLSPTPPLSSLRHEGEADIGARGEELITGVLNNSISTVKVRGKDIPFKLAGDLREALASGDLNIRESFKKAYENRRNLKISPKAHSISFYIYAGEVESNTYSEGVGP